MQSIDDKNVETEGGDKDADAQQKEREEKLRLLSKKLAIRTNVKAGSLSAHFH